MIVFAPSDLTGGGIWQNPGDFPLSGLADMAHPRPPLSTAREPSRLLVKHGSQIYSIRLRRHRRARPYTLRIHRGDREAILTMPSARHA